MSCSGTFPYMTAGLGWNHQPFDCENNCTTEPQSPQTTCDITLVSLIFNAVDGSNIQQLVNLQQCYTQEWFQFLYIQPEQVKKEKKKMNIKVHDSIAWILTQTEKLMTYVFYPDSVSKISAGSESCLLLKLCRFVNLSCARHPFVFSIFLGG